MALLREVIHVRLAVVPRRLGESLGRERDTGTNIGRGVPGKKLGTDELEAEEALKIASLRGSVGAVVISVISDDVIAKILHLLGADEKVERAVINLVLLEHILRLTHLLVSEADARTAEVDGDSLIAVVGHNARASSAFVGRTSKGADNERVLNAADGLGHLLNFLRIRKHDVLKGGHIELRAKNGVFSRTREEDAVLEAIVSVDRITAALSNLVSGALKDLVETDELALTGLNNTSERGEARTLLLILRHEGSIELNGELVGNLSSH